MTRTEMLGEALAGLAVMSLPIVLLFLGSALGLK